MSSLDNSFGSEVSNETVVPVSEKAMDQEATKIKETEADINAVEPPLDEDSNPSLRVVGDFLSENIKKFPLVTKENIKKITEVISNDELVAIMTWDVVKNTPEMLNDIIKTELDEIRKEQEKQEKLIVEENTEEEFLLFL